MTQIDDPFGPLSAPVRSWFTREFPSGPTPAQVMAWPVIAARENTLLISPTGSGKTLAAFLAILDQCHRERERGSVAPNLRCLYVSPLKSLGYDIETNLKRPLKGLGEDLVHVGVRTGDTTAHARRKMREDDAARFSFASDFVKGRVQAVKSEMAALDVDLARIAKDDKSIIDAKTGTRNEFMRGLSRKLDMTVTGFNAFRTDPQLKQIRSDLAERADKTTIADGKGGQISCPDPQLSGALKGVVRT